MSRTTSDHDRTYSIIRNGLPAYVVLGSKRYGYIDFESRHSMKKCPYGERYGIESVYCRFCRRPLMHVCKNGGESAGGYVHEIMDDERRCIDTRKILQTITEGPVP